MIERIPLQTWGQELPIDFSSNAAIALFVVFSLVMIGIGLYASRSQDSEEDYYAAGRGAGLWVIALSAFASIQSGWGLVGTPGTYHLLGLEPLVWFTFAPFGMVLGYFLLARKMRVLGEVKNAMTAPDAVYHRFKDERARLLAATAVFLGVIGYLAAQYAALGVIGSLILPVGFFEALLISFIVVGLYTVLGGILAAIWSDAVQGAMMALAGLFTGWYLFTNYPGGLGGAMGTLSAEAPQLLQLKLLGAGGVAPIGLSLSVIIIMFTIPALPHLITRFYMTRTVGALKWGALITGGAYLVTTLIWWTGPVMRAAVIDGSIQVPNPDTAMPLALINFAPPFIAAFVLVAVIAAVMSTSNAFLNLGAASIMHDVVSEYMGKDLTDDQEVLYGRITTAAVLVGAFALAAGSGSLVFVLGAAGWGIFVSVLLPGIVFGYNWKGATTEGLLAGGSTALVLTLVLAYGGQFGLLTLPMGFLGGQVATVAGVVVFIAVSLVTSSNTYEDLDRETQIAMDTPKLGDGSSSTQPEGVPSDD
ncbi:sodium:solute symporter family transporter [Natronomonas marina]|uniref:sodium:solute symporter family transporter n=1 Tax=Natronomonas marina TaxID=2961939 RepID=UPI0020C9428C|nr:hypothetical protein [Natronomonas marina]